MYRNFKVIIIRLIFQRSRLKFSFPELFFREGVLAHDSGLWEKLVTIDSQDLERRNFQIIDSPHCCLIIVRDFQRIFHFIRNEITVRVLIIHLRNKSKAEFIFFVLHLPVRINVEQFPINQNAPGILQLIDKCLSHDCDWIVETGAL